MEYKHFSPGLHKLIHHQQHLYKIDQGDVVAPIHVSVWPTNACQLYCEYCCFGKITRDKTELNIDDFMSAIDTLTKYGTKAIEFSGGGEPLLWKSFHTAVSYVFDKHLKLSLVTNGLLLPYISREILSKFDWIRVSIQSLDYARKISFTNIPNNVRYSMSFIVYDEISLKAIKDLASFSINKDIVIRVAPTRPCSREWETKVETEVNKYGYPLLFFKKEFGTPLGCYMIWLRAAIDWKGNFLPCPSIELTDESAGKIPEDFAVCHITKLEQWLLSNPPSDLGYRCSFCNCGKEMNDYIYNLMQSVENVEFV